MVNAQFGPLGLGNTRTADPPNGVGCNPHEMLCWFRNTDTSGPTDIDSGSGFVKAFAIAQSANTKIIE
jgi:hypothetical protein